MCLPVAALTIPQMLSIGLSAGGAVMSYATQRQAANAQTAALHAGNAQTQRQLEEQARQINAQTTAEQVDLQRESMKRRGAMRVAAGEAGLSGLVLSSILQAESAETGIAYGRNATNNRNARGQNAETRRGSNARTQSSINQIKRPSLIATGLQIAGAAADQFATIPAAPKVGATA